MHTAIASLTEVETPGEALADLWARHFRDRSYVPVYKNATCEIRGLTGSRLTVFPSRPLSIHGRGKVSMWPRPRPEQANEVQFSKCKSNSPHLVTRCRLVLRKSCNLMAVLIGLAELRCAFEESADAITRLVSVWPNFQ